MKNFFMASRPKTLIVSIFPPTVSFYYAFKITPQIPVYLLLCTVLSAMLIQMATNFFNDLIDHQKGSDKIRLGPKRVTASGLVSEKTIKKWAYGSVLGALILSIPLVLRGGPIILVLGLVSLYLTYGYTGGIISLAYRGLGEIFVFLFFGLFSFLGSLYIYASEINLTALLMATQFGLLSVTFIGINNLRDRDLDKAVNKMTLATRMSSFKYRLLVSMTILLPYLLLFGTSGEFGFSYWGLLIAMPFCGIVYTKEGSQLNVGLKWAAIHMILFSILTIMDISYGHLF
jgi:1,4-dihydroxy-2-naphthoate octaprenyltransferase